MKVLLVNQTFYPDSAASAQALQDVAAALQEQGCHVTVLAGRVGYLNGTKYAAHEIHAGVSITRVWPFSVRRKNRLLRMSCVVGANLAFFIALLRQKGFNKIVALTSPPMVSAFAALAAKIQKSSFVYWVLDMNPDQAIAAGWLKGSGLAARLIKNIDVRTLKAADRIIVPDRYMKERLTGKGIIPEKVTEIPMWAPQDLQVNDDGVNDFRVRYGLERDFVVMYSGNHSICHPLGTILGAALQLRGSGVHFLFVGNGVRAEEVAQFRRLHALSNITQLPYQQRGELPGSLAAADLHLVVMGEPFVGIVHPSKVYGILAAGRPFAYIGPVHGPMADLVRQLDPTLAVEHGDAAGLARVISNFRCRPMEKVAELRLRAADISSNYLKKNKAAEVARCIVS